MNESSTARLVEHAEAAAYADMMRAAPSGWGCVVEHDPSGWFLMAPTLDMILFNRLVGWGLDSAASRTAIDQALERYRAASLANFGVQLSPVAGPPSITQWLGDAGLRRGDSWSKMYRAPGTVPKVATDLRIEEVGREYAMSASSIACAAFDMPQELEPWIASLVGRSGWHHYLAFDGADPVGTAALFINGDIGWLGVAGTMPRARRRGAQGALMERRLNDGRALGCRWLVTETGQETPDHPNPSYHNMLRLGFDLAYHRPNYLHAAKNQS